MTENSYELNKNLAQMLKVGIMDVQGWTGSYRRGCWCGSCYDLGRIPADIRAAGEVHGDQDD